MTHHMHLSSTPFERIASGRQTIEARVNDEKRQLLSVGDQIEFTLRGDMSKKFSAKITLLMNHASFKDLYSADRAEKFGDKNREELMRAIYQYYSKEDEERWGVVGIVLELLS